MEMYRIVFETPQSEPKLWTDRETDQLVSSLRPCCTYCILNVGYHFKMQNDKTTMKSILFFLTIIFLNLCFNCGFFAISFTSLWQVWLYMLLQSFGHGESLSTLLANIRPLSSVCAAVILKQCHGFAGFATIGTGIPIQAKMNLFMRGELRWFVEGLAADWTLKGVLLCVGFLVGHKLCGVREVAVADIASKKGISQYAMFIFCWVAQLEMTLFALVVTEDYVALHTLQGELRCWRETRQEGGNLYMWFICSHILRIKENTCRKHKGLHKKNLGKYGDFRNRWVAS